MTKDIKVVIGANFGDEGKGLTTDYFAEQERIANRTCIVVLSNGGSQRSHTVSTSNGKRHIFRHFGSGSFVWAATYLPKQFIVNPMNYATEVADLKYNVTCYAHPECLVTTPFDMLANQMIEDARGNSRHGSCGIGIWETILRNGINLQDMANMYYEHFTHKALYEYLYYIKEDYFKKRLRSKGIRLHGKWKKAWNNKNLIDKYIKDVETMLSHVRYASTMPDTYQSIIFENGQGLLLDQNIVGYNKNITPSNTGLQNPAAMIREIPDDKDVEVCYVSRTYMTRHGAGRFDTEWDYLANKFKDETNVSHPYQGDMRYGLLNVDSMIDRCTADFQQYAEENWKMSFMLTHVNEMKVHFDKFKDFTLYTSDGLTRESVKGGVR